MQGLALRSALRSALHMDLFSPWLSPAGDLSFLPTRCCHQSHPCALVLGVLTSKDWFEAEAPGKSLTWIPKSLPLPTPLSHTLPLCQPRLRSGLQLPSALLLLLLLSVLGPGAGECRAGKNEAGMGFWQGGVDWRDSREVGRWQPDGWGRSREK